MRVCARRLLPRHSSATVLSAVYKGAQNGTRAASVLIIADTRARLERGLEHASHEYITTKGVKFITTSWRWATRCCDLVVQLTCLVQSAMAIESRGAVN